MDIFQETHTFYLGKRERIAVVYVGNQAKVLGLSDTRSCAQSLEHCRFTLYNLGVPRTQVDHFAPGLQQHCRDLTNFKQGFFSKENPNGVKRDRPRPRMWRRQYF